MPLLVEDCPRCGAQQHTFDVLASTPATCSNMEQRVEVFCCCRECKRATIFVIGLRESLHRGVAVSIMQVANLNHSFTVIEFINQSHIGAESPPSHLPDAVRTAFEEATRAFAIGCWNAAGCMFRVSIDLVTKEIHSEKGGPDRLPLSRRLSWLFDNGHIPSDLRDLAMCINDDGNDAAHIAGLTKEDAEDLLDFSRELLRRIYTESARVKMANERRKRRRDKAKQTED